jgi:hypothetical protein
MVRAADGWDGKRSVSNRSMERDSSMVQLFLIGLGAGTATALLFASVASGSPLSVLLFYLAPLPILIAALGWSHWAALVAAVAASAGLAAVFGGFFFLAFLLGVGLPAWWLGYLALLARPGAAPGALQWYPVGHLVVWAAIVAAVIVIVGMLHFGTDEEAFRASLRKAMERMLNITPAAGKDAAQRPDMSRLIDFLIAALPPAAAVLTTVTSVVNLWLAERVVKISGRLHRPPPDLSAMRFPAYAPSVAAAALVASFLPGLLGIGAGVLGAALLMAYGILGFAVLHAITRGMGGRPVALGGAYAAVIFFGWPVLAMSALGLADSAFDFRGRAARRRQPPPSHPGT